MCVEKKKKILSLNILASGTAGTVNKTLQTFKMNDSMLGLNTSVKEHGHVSYLFSPLFLLTVLVFGNFVR